MQNRELVQSPCDGIEAEAERSLVGKELGQAFPFGELAHDVGLLRLRQPPEVEDPRQAEAVEAFEGDGFANEGLGFVLARKGGERLQCDEATVESIPNRMDLAASSPSQGGDELVTRRQTRRGQCGLTRYRNGRPRR